MQICPINYNLSINNYNPKTSFGSKNIVCAKNYEELAALIPNKNFKTILVDWNISNQEVSNIVKNWYSRGGNIHGGSITNRGGIGFFEEFHHSHLTENAEADKKTFFQYLSRFINKKPNEVELLDAGCGEGKEVKSFLDMGYNASGFDSSLDCVNMAKRNSCAHIVNATFNDFNSNKRFDAIWTRKALQHVAKSGFVGAIQNLVNHLKQNGILFAITKLDNQPINGVGRQLFNENRLFHNFLSERELLSICSDIKGAQLASIELTANQNAYDITDTRNIIFVLKKITS